MTRLNDYFDVNIYVYLVVIKLKTVNIDTGTFEGISQVVYMSLSQWGIVNITVRALYNLRTIFDILIYRYLTFWLYYYASASVCRRIFLSTRPLG